MVSVRISTPQQEGVLQMSKWLKFQVLLDPEEMGALLEEIGPVYFVHVSSAVPADAAVHSADYFLERYRAYVEQLQRGCVPNDTEYRALFSSALTSDLSAFYAIAVGAQKVLMKPIAPVIQMQMHYFFYSAVDAKFHPMVLSEESIAWGVQFAYPQLYQDPVTRAIGKVADSSQFTNTHTFQKLAKWMRSSTLPTPFDVNHARTNSPIRIGKKALSWVNAHPQLKQKGIVICG